jgi:hypothetical protein
MIFHPSNKFHIFFASAMLFTLNIAAQTNLIPFGSTWKYLDNGSNQGTVWKGTSFNDVSWKTGIGKFGYGISDAVTNISYGTNSNKKYITTYFRKSFTISNATLYSSYTASVKRDDGVAVYINGIEVYRNNLPSGTLGYTTKATSASDNGTINQAFQINASAFVSGTNVIAVEIHQDKTNTPDMAFDLALVGNSDLTAPSVTSINRQSPSTQITSTTSVTYRVTFSEKVNGVDVSDFTPTAVSGTVSGSISSITSVGTTGDIYDVTGSSITGDGTLRLDLKASGTDITDQAGNAIGSGYSSGQTYVIDHTAPIVNSINRQSPSTQTTSAASVTYRVTFSEAVSGVDASDFTATAVSGPVSGTAASVAVVGTTGDIYDVTVTSITGSGTLRLDLKASGTGITDAAGNTINGGYSNGDTYIIQAADLTAPIVNSINRQSPSTQTTSATSVTYRVTFSEAVSGVDVSDFTATAVSGTVSGSISSVTSVGTTGDIYDVIVSSITGDGTLRLDLNGSGTGITDDAANAISGGYSSGQTYVIDHTAPIVNSINRQSPSTQTTNASTLTFRTTFSEKVNNVDYTDFTFSIVLGTVSGTLNNLSVVAVGSAGTTYDVTINSVNGNGTVRLDLNGSGTGITDDAGNAIAGGFTAGETYIVNQAAPSLTSVHISSSNSNSSLARTGDVITLSFTASEPINPPTVTIATHAVTSTAGSGNTFTATYTMTGTDAETTVPFTIDFTSTSGNPGTQVSTTTDGSSVRFDKTVPAVTSINRQSPLTQTTNASTLTFRATFSEKVNNVDYTDFNFSIVSGTVSGPLNNLSVVAVGSTGTTYDVTVNSVSGNGTVKLDLNGAGTGITDDAGNAIAGGFTAGETYIVNQTTLQGFASITNLSPLTVSATTGEKPQSKVWTYDGKYWTVLPNSTGTYLWRLDGTTWTSILKLSTLTTSKADCKKVGNVVHILLYQGASSQLASAEYVPASQTYKLWSNRTSTVGLTLDSGVETAVIDIDGTGRMWLASAGVSDINVRWSDAPYSTWSSPVTVATGATDDDICTVIYMSALNKIGVLWSNQNTKRFGFRTHADGASPSTWSADEVPASQSALNVGKGMADDAMNIAVASDGTLYCAVKTNYDLAGYPTLALLIRRPAGNWDNLYEVSQTGTRPIALLNESIGKIRVVYSLEGGGDILYKESFTSSISFGSQLTLITGGLYSNATSTKDNFTSEIVILASDNTKAVGVLASDNQTAANNPPNIPTNPSPANQDYSPANSTTLCATVSDPENNQLRVRYYGRKKTAQNKFTLIMLPDTQFYTAEPQGTNGGNNAMFKSQTSWIANNRAGRNIVYVGHLGDCAEHGDTYEVEWKRADTAIKTIENPTLTGLTQGIPYGVCVGNHDQTPENDPNGTTTFYNQYFGSSRFNGRSYYGGHQGSNNDNNYQLFSASGIDFLVISLEFDKTTSFASGTVLNWTDSLVRSYPGRKVIVMSHSVLELDATFSVLGQAVYDRLKVYPNFILMIGGHENSGDGEAKRTDTYNGNKVTTILSNYQSRINGGNGLMRIYEFDPATNNVGVQTYSPYTNTYETDANSQFNLSVNFNTNANYTLISELNNVTSGSNACVNWTSLEQNADYEWYVEVYDGQFTTTGPTWSFTTNTPIASSSTQNKLYGKKIWSRR